MTNYDREFQEKLARIDARLTQHEMGTRVGLGLLTALATAGLALMVYHVIKL